MKLKVQKLTEITKLIKKITGDKNLNAGVLLKTDIENDKLIVRFADKHNIINTNIDAEFGAEESAFEKVVSIGVLSNIIQSCQPTASIRVDDLLIETDGENLQFETTKFVEVASSGDDEEAVDLNQFADEDGYIDQESMDEYLAENGGASVERHNVSHIVQKVKANDLGTDVKHGILSRVDYNNMMTAGEVIDVWSKADLTAALNKLKTDTKTVLFSGRKKCAFVVNTAYTVVRQTSDDKEVTIAISAGTVATLLSVLSFIKADEFELTVYDSPFAVLRSTDEDFGYAFDIGKITEMEIQSAKTFMGINYNSFSIQLMKDVLLDMINSMSNMGNKDTDVKFCINGDTANVSGVGTAGHQGNFDLNLVSQDGETDGLELRFNINNLKSMLNLCNNTFIEISGLIAEDDEKSKFICIKDAEGVDENGNIATHTTIYSKIN